MEGCFLKSTKRLMAPMVIAVLIVACGDVDNPGKTRQAISSIKESTILQTIERLGRVQDDHHSNAVESSKRLSRSVQIFLAAPGDATLQSLKGTWLEAHYDFLAARFFSFVETDLQNFSVDAWPIQEGFLDRLPQYPHSGIISDITLSINSATLREQHGITDPEEVSLGFHALEFLLFSRNIEDYSLDGGTATLRRRQALGVIAEVLDQDVELMLSESRIATRDYLASTNNGSPIDIRSLLPILEALYSRVSLLFVEANDISEISGHSRFSQSSLQNLQAQVGVLSELTGERTELDAVFLLLDQNITAEYRTTLGQTVVILAMEDLGEEQNTRLRLLLAALGHQLDDFRMAMTRSIKLQASNQDPWQL